MTLPAPVLVLALALLVFLPSVRSASDGRQAEYSKIVAFGDSFTDNGDGARVLSNGSWPPPYYDNGRFSNGPVWIEYVAKQLNVSLKDYAVGGATTSNLIVAGFTGNGSTIPVPSVDEQVTSYLKSTPSDIATTLFAVTGGANDIFFNYNISALTSASILAQSISRLQNAGAQHFILFNYYDIALTPFASYVDVATKVVVQTFSTELGFALAALAAQTAKSTPDVTYLDLKTELMPRFYYYGEPTTYGFDQYGAYGSCLTGVYMENGKGKGVTDCGAEVDKKVFWDEYHFTTTTHKRFAEAVLQKLKF